MVHVNCAAIYGVVSMRFVGVCYALGVLEQCFGSVKAMLLRVQEQCFGDARAMLWGCKSNALRVQGQCFEDTRAMLWLY